MTTITALPVATVCVLAVAALACVWDLKSARIPNWLTFTAAAAAIVFHTFAPQGRGVGPAVAGLLLGLAIFFPLFALRAMGAGDVKLLAAVGAWIGWVPVFWVAAYGSVAGGVLALLIMLVRGHFRQGMQNIWVLLMFWRASGIRALPSVSLDNPHSVRMPYAVPIAVGLMVTLWQR